MLSCHIPSETFFVGGVKQKQKTHCWGLPWWFSGQDSTLPMQGAQGRCEAAIETREKEAIPGSTEGPAGD